MNENATLLLILVILSLLQCGIWVRRDVLAFVPGWDGLFRPRHPLPALGNHRTGLVFAPFLPLSRAPVLCPPWPFSATPEAAYAYLSLAPYPDVRVTQEESFVRLDDIRTVEFEERRIHVNGAHFVTAPTERTAGRWARRLSEWAKLPVGRREAAIAEVLAASLDAEKARDRVRELESGGSFLRAACHLLFLHLFVVSPALVLWQDLVFALPVIVPGLLSLLAVVTVSFYYAHRALHPDAGSERWRHLAMIVLYPPEALRAVDRLAAGVLDGFHPLAAAAALCPRATFLAFARTVLLDARHPRRPACSAEDPARRGAEAGFRALALAGIEACLRRAGVDPEELARPPAPLDARSQSYCPRCGDQYVLAQGACWDCGGLVLLPLPGRAASAP